MIWKITSQNPSSGQPSLTQMPNPNVGLWDLDWDMHWDGSRDGDLSWEASWETGGPTMDTGILTWDTGGFDEEEQPDVYN